MQAVYDHRTGNILMISIPRDSGIDIRKDCLSFKGAINQAYVRGQRSNCEGKGIQVLKDTVESVTGIKSQYHVFVSLDAFEEVIKVVGETNAKGEVGIVVDNPKDTWDVYPVDTGWVNVYFPKGRLFLTPYRALQYARTRQYTSDFDRAERQQLIVEAVIKRFLSSDVMLNPAKINELMETYKSKLIFSEPKDLGELMTMIDLARQIDMEKIYHVVLDPEFGGHEKFLNKAPHDRPGPYYMVPTAWKECPGNEFCKVQERIQEILVDPDLIE
jgi:LCP family protein required for cell wall assembly